MNAEQLQEYRELTERLSFFGLEGRAQDAITALLAEVERLQAQVAEVERLQAQVAGDVVEPMLWKAAPPHRHEWDEDAATTPA